MASSGTPKVSVLMPVRDGATELPETILSLTRQDLDDFEVVVVDDGSSDETPLILDEWARKDPRAHVIKSSPLGIAAALEVGFEATHGELIARMDADDVAMPSRLSKQLAAFEADPRLDVLGTHVRMFPRGKRLRDGMRRYERWLAGLTTHDEIMRNLFIESPLCHPSVMMKRSTLVDAGGYRDFDGPEDYDLWLRLAERGAHFRNLDEVLLLWRHRLHRATITDRRYRSEAFHRLKLDHLKRWRLGDERRVGIWGAGPLGKSWARGLVDGGLQVLFYVDVDPKKVGQRIHGTPVIPMDALPAPGETFLLIAVGVDGARELIRDELTRQHYTEGKHYLCLQ